MMNIGFRTQRLLRWKFRFLLPLIPAPLYGPSELRYLAGLLLDRAEILEEGN